MAGDSQKDTAAAKDAQKSKDDKKKPEEKEEELSDEDLELKRNLELMVERVMENDLGEHLWRPLGVVVLRKPKAAIWQQSVFMLKMLIDWVDMAPCHAFILKLFACTFINPTPNAGHRRAAARVGQHDQGDPQRHGVHDVRAKAP
eukprot:250757-Chlamydomonas_euryale.AAC.11